MAQIAGNKRNNPRARTASDFEIKPREYAKSAHDDGWKEYESTYVDEKTASAKQESIFSPWKGYLVLPVAVLGWALAVYQFVGSGTKSDDLKNQEYISTLRVSIDKLEAEKLKTVADAKTASKNIEELKVAERNLQNQKATISENIKSLCRTLSDTQKSITAARKNCGASSRDVCSALPIIQDSAIQKYCGAATN